jgi:5'-3' exonuclease
VKKYGYLLIDGMNVAHANNAGAILKSGDQETQAIYGSLRAIRKSVATFPMLKPVILWDGPKNWRKRFYPEYKANRDKEATTKHEIESQRRRESLKVQLPILKRGITTIGVSQVVSQNLEADDLAGILVRRYQPRGDKIMLVTGDKDWIQLLGPGVGWFDTINDKRITAGTISQKLGYEKVTKDRKTGEETTEWRGVPNAQAWLEIKALMGDPSDNLPGVGGVGEKGAIDLVNRFGSVKRFFEAVEIDKIDVPKRLADFAASQDKKEIFYRNLHLMDLNHNDIPKAEAMVVNTKPQDEAAFTDFCKELAFTSILKDVPGWLATFNSQR